MQTSQAIFEKVARHLFAQGRQAAYAGSCKYRGPQGTMCAMGVLIPDELYKSDYEGCTASMLFDMEEFDELFPSDVRTLIMDLQWAHDDESSWDTSEALTNALIEVGVKHGLKVEFIDSLYFGQDK